MSAFRLDTLPLPLERAEFDALAAAAEIPVVDLAGLGRKIIHAAVARQIVRMRRHGRWDDPCADGQPSAPS